MPLAPPVTSAVRPSSRTSGSLRPSGTPPYPPARMPSPVPIVGGTGALGFGIALRLAREGVPVVIGSRVPERARAGGDRSRERGHARGPRPSLGRGRAGGRRLAGGQARRGRARCAGSGTAARRLRPARGGADDRGPHAPPDLGQRAPQVARRREAHRAARRAVVTAAAPP